VETIKSNIGLMLPSLCIMTGTPACLMGNVDNKNTLVNGTAEEVTAETIDCLRQGAPDGGYILCSDHSLKDDMPNENVFQLYETGRKYGRYPLALDDFPNP